jgi:class 3 adenylate cyclase
VDTAGDSVLAEFPTATDAVSCAVEIQGSLGGRNAALTAERRMEFRIGVHVGEVRTEADRIRPPTPTSSNAGSTACARPA